MSPQEVKFCARVCSYPHHDVTGNMAETRHIDHHFPRSIQANCVMEDSADRATARIGIVTVSDRASRGEYEDRGGPAIRDYLTEVLTSEWQAVARVVADDRGLLESTLIELCDRQHCCLIITTGGTGPAPRDITPEATEAVVEKMMPGFGELMRQVSLRAVPTAILSRQTAGIRGRCLILNLPGQPKAIGECLDAVFPAIPYCIDLIEGPFLTTNPGRLLAFRPQPK